MSTALHSKAIAQANLKPHSHNEWASRKWIAIVAFVYLALTSFPRNVNALSDCIDGQLLWNLHYLAQSSYIYGKDILFVYGPLGYLQYPFHMGLHLEVSAFLSLIVCGAQMASAYLLLANGARSPLRALLFAAMMLLAAQYPTSTEGDINQLSLTMAYLPLAAPQLAIPLAILLGVISATTVFVKFNAGVSSIILSAAAGFCWWLNYKRRSLPWIAATGLSFILSFAILSASLLKTLPNLILWLRGMRDIAAGYSETHSLIASSAQPLSVLLVIAACLAFLLALWRSNSELTLPALLTGILFLFAFKHSIVRQDDDHLLFVATTIPIGLAYLTLLSKSKRETAVLACIFSGSLLLFSQWHLQMQRSWSDYLNYITCRSGLQNIQSLAQWNKTLAGLDAISAATISHWHLPSEAVAAIGKGSVDVVPTERLYPLADNLTWRPNPVLNFYMAQTPYLDELTAQHFGGAKAPDFLLASLIDIDYRHPFYCAPLSWRAILDNYGSHPVNKELSAKWNIMSVLVLQKEAGRTDKLTPLPHETEGTTGSWIDVPNCPEMLYGQFEMRRTAFGAASAIAYQIPPAWIDLEYLSGQKQSYRFVPSQSKNGLLLNYLPNTLADLDNLFHKQSGDRITRFRVRVPGGRLCFEKTIHIKWMRGSIPITNSLETKR